MKTLLNTSWKAFMKTVLLWLCINANICKAVNVLQAEVLKDMFLKWNMHKETSTTYSISQKELYNLLGFPEILVCRINNECFKLTYNVYTYMCCFLRNWNFSFSALMMLNLYGHLWLGRQVIQYHGDSTSMWGIIYLILSKIT